MKIRQHIKKEVKRWFLSILMPLAAFSAPATTRYVNVNNANPQSPYDEFSKAATQIQDAVDVADAGDLILVTNGVYSTGGQSGGYYLTNRVEVTKALEVRSFNGPEVTFIKGSAAPGSARCVCLTSGAILSGFTLTNGHTVHGMLTLFDERYGGGVFSWSSSAIVTNCTLIGNYAYECGGGAYSATLNDCSLTSNYVFDTASAYSRGGGAFESTLNNCVLTGNYAYDAGGGAFGSTLNNCILTGNSANYGAGAAGSVLNNCALTDNMAYFWGGGAYGGTLNNCSVASNILWGTCDSTLNNCIVYYNEGFYNGAGNFLDGTLNCCCTTPMPTNGVGNITNEPLFVNLTGGDLHLQSSSPCINAGLNGAVSSLVDLDNNPRIRGGIVDMGAYESLSVEPVTPQFVNFQPPSTDGMTLTLYGDTGAVEIYASSNLTTWSWMVTMTNINGQILYIDPDAANHPQRFYRAIQLP